MNVPSKVLAWLVLAIVFLPSSLLPPLAMAQGAPQPLSPEQIDQLVAPIALHPDKLLAQILMASTYPLEVVQAARFVKENPKVQGDQLNEALKRYTWDDSVKSLVFFPQVLTMLNDKLDWLQKLGDAFLAQQKEVLIGMQCDRTGATARTRRGQRAAQEHPGAEGHRGARRCGAATDGCAGAARRDHGAGCPGSADHHQDRAAQSTGRLHAEL